MRAALGLSAVFCYAAFWFAGHRLPTWAQGVLVVAGLSLLVATYLIHT